jgi:methionyl-tRNA formyltransferase
VGRCAVVEWALERNIDVFCPERMNDETIRWLRDRSTECALVLSYGHILPDTLLQIPPKGMWNIHTSLLPRYRGPSPIQQAVLNGDGEAGLTFMKMVRQMDAGPILSQCRVPIEDGDTYGSLRQRLSVCARPFAAACLARVRSGHFTLTEQDELQATYTRKIAKEDGQLNFHLPASVLERRVRAFDPWPGSYVYIRGVRVKVGGVVVDHGPDGTRLSPGTVVTAGPIGLMVRTVEHNLVLTHLQREGGKMLTAGEFLRGFGEIVDVVKYQNISPTPNVSHR